MRCRDSQCRYSQNNAALLSGWWFGSCTTTVCILLQPVPCIQQLALLAPLPVCVPARTEVVGLLLVKELLAYAFPNPGGTSPGSPTSSFAAAMPATTQVGSVNLRPLPR